MTQSLERKRVKGAKKVISLLQKNRDCEKRMYMCTAEEAQVARKHRMQVLFSYFNEVSENLIRLNKG